MRFVSDLIELFFPRTCCLCGAPLVGSEHELCTHCFVDLPEAVAARADNNFVERRLAGRIPAVHATTLMIFRHGNKAQSVLHQIKYRGNTKLALSMGQMLGNQISQSTLFDDIDYIIPVPLHRRKERRRGYNQSLLICQGIAQSFPRPVLADNLIRLRHTQSQTHKNRMQRLENMKNVFALRDPAKLCGKHILLVDDVITTGATTEACYETLKQVENLRISIASLAITGDT